MFKNEAGMQCSPEQVEFFRILTKITNAKKGIEIGNNFIIIIKFFNLK